MNEELDGERLSTPEARLLAALGGALGEDPMPASLVERAEELLALRDLDADLAELLDRAEPAGMRGGTGPTRLEFEAGDGSVALELVPGPGRLVGQVLAGAVTEVVLERPGGPSDSTGVDGLGRFSFAPVAAGPARLRLVGGTAAPVTTDWFLL